MDSSTYQHIEHHKCCSQQSIILDRIDHLASLGIERNGVLFDGDISTGAWVQRIPTGENNGLQPWKWIKRCNKYSDSRAKAVVKKISENPTYPFAKHLKSSVQAHIAPRAAMEVANELLGTHCNSEQLEAILEWMAKSVRRYCFPGSEHSGVLALMGRGGTGKNLLLDMLIPTRKQMEVGISWSKCAFKKLSKLLSGFIIINELGGSDHRYWDSFKDASTLTEFSGQEKGKQSESLCVVRASFALTSNSANWLPDEAFDDGSIRRLIPIIFYEQLKHSPERQRQLCDELWSAVIKEFPYWLSLDTQKTRDFTSILDSYKRNPYASESSSDKVMDWLNAQDADFIPASLVSDALPEMKPSQLKAVILQSGLWTHTRKRLEPNSNPVSVFKRQQEVF